MNEIDTRCYLFEFSVDSVYFLSDAMTSWISLT